ncbi:MAG: response regulator [Methylocystis sp.]|jgi:DNA-binding response OmpR family regulator
MRILVVDDEPMVAMSLELLVQCEGFESAGIASTVEDALTLVSQGGFDAVILDANLGGVFSHPVAEALQKAKIPFVVLSGYDPQQQQGRFPPNTRFLQKPCRPETLFEALRAPSA